MKLIKLILVVLVAVGLLTATLAVPSNPGPLWKDLVAGKKGDGDIIGGKQPRG